ncbi:Ham1 family protein [Fusarium austroafricanum]|uniref:Inosine triphosphate pyrophosphatase n=1 Tax=Fusarium austroafricanum TaxID=2364996 RepID=A0A8H4KU00_9HYPO|nr:Ham1 family protein [Fusarium austroafricanum]
MTMKEINLITGNANKINDIKAILVPTGFTVRNQALDLPEIQGSIEEITIAKCRKGAEMVGGPVVVDDTALCFNAMDGMPGPYIKFFLEALGPEQLHLLLAGFPDKTAEAIATIGYSRGPGHEPVLFQGRINGTIVPARGVMQYGWQTCFEVDGMDLTLAEMPDEEKHKISHLGIALQKFSTWFEKDYKCMIEQND